MCYSLSQALAANAAVDEKAALAVNAAISGKAALAAGAGVWKQTVL